MYVQRTRADYVQLRTDDIITIPKIKNTINPLSWAHIDKRNNYSADKESIHLLKNGFNNPQLNIVTDQMNPLQPHKIYSFRIYFRIIISNMITRFRLNHPL